jgi:Leucine-rich repeat (LRR) protein
VLNLSDNQLRVESVPDQLSTAFKNLRSINLSHNFFESIPTFFSASNFTNLHSIDLSSNPIGKILDGTITELVSLQELRLNSCSITFLPANIARLVNLETLELRENYLETLPLTIRLLTRLRLLDVGRNNFEELPMELGYLFSIQELLCDENCLIDLSVVGELINLKSLDISSNNLMDFPEEITKCLMLETLYADVNEFETLPESIGNLKRLQRLNLNYVRLKSLPSGIGQCESLQELNIHENYLEYLPPTIGFLRNLQSLVAYENRLMQLPVELASCVSLTHLNLANNKLNKLPDNIGYLKNLRSINVIGNYLMYLPLSLGMIQNLEGLWLSPYQEGMRKPNLQRVEFGEIGIVLTSPLLEQNYRPFDQKSALKSQCKIHFSVNNNSVLDEENEEEAKRRNENEEKLRSPVQIMRMPTPTQRERKRLEKFAKNINAERKDLSKSFEIKEAKVANINACTSGGATYSNTPRQRRSLDPEYIEINNSSEIRPLPPPYQVACQYSKMTASELENFQKMSRNGTSNDSSHLPLLSTRTRND